MPDPQFFSFLDLRLAMGLGIALNFLAAGLLVYRYPASATEAFAIAAAGGGFSLFVLQCLVSRIINQSAERAGIIDQLEATRTELAAAQREAGRLAERQRLAGDIHDILAQGFTSILMLIQAAQADLDGSHPRAGRHLDLAARTAREKGHGEDAPAARVRQARRLRPDRRGDQGDRDRRPARARLAR